MGTSKKRGNGEGTIFKREINGKTYWIAEYTIEMTDKNGKRRRKTISGKTRQEVKTKLEKLITEINTNSLVNKSKIQLKDLAKEYIDYEYKINKLSQGSYKRKLESYKMLCTHYIAEKEIQKLNENDIKDFFIFLTNYSDSVISKVYGVLNNTLKIAVKRNIIRYNFLDDKFEFSKPKSKKETKKVRGFNMEEHQNFINAIATDTAYKYHYQLLLSLYTGMRMGEVNALNINDIDYKNKTITIKRTLTRDINYNTIISKTTKTENGQRTIPLTETVENILKKYLKTEYKPNKENLLFYNTEKDTYYTTSQINMAFKRFCKHYNIGIGYEVNQHMLRHTYATRCIEAGMPANVLSKLMGHANIKITLDTYCDVFDEYERTHATNTIDYLSSNNLILDLKI